MRCNNYAFTMLKNSFSRGNNYVATIMPHNPFAWAIFALTMGLMLTTMTRFLK